MSPFDPLDIQAYQDGQLPPDQAQKIEDQLSPEQKRQLRAARILEERIVEKLKASTDSCPDPLWQSIQQQIQERAETPRRPRRLFSYLSAAACIALLLGLILWQRDTSPAKAIEIMVDFPQDVQEFKRRVSTVGKAQDIQASLHEQGYHIHIGDIPAYNQSHGHHVAFIGMDPVNADGKEQPGVCLHFTCCGRPVSSYILKDEDATATRPVTIKPARADIKQTSNDKHGYRIVTLSPHPTEPVASLVAPADE